MKKIIAVIICSVIHLSVFADGKPYRIEDLLQHTSLSVQGKITSYTDTTATIFVMKILHNYRTGIKENDYLKIQNDFSVICPVGIPLEYAQQKREGIFFLRFHKNKWYLTVRDVALIKDGKAELSFTEEGYKYRASVEEWKSDLRGYYENFKQNAEFELRPKLDEKAWVKEIAMSALAQLQYKSYYNDYFRSLAKHPRLDPIELYAPEEEKPYATISTNTNIQEPIVSDKVMEISRQIAENAKILYPELVESQVEGVTYYSLFFDEEGSIVKVKIDLPVHGRLNEAIEEYYKEYIQWTPALDEHGEPIRFRQQLFMRFKN